MSTETSEWDEVLDQVLEDDRAAALEDFRKRDEVAIEFTPPFTDIP